MRLRARSAGVVAAIAATATVLSGCSGSSPDDSEKISLKIAVRGDAQHIRDWVIPEFERTQRAKGKDVTVSLVQAAEDELKAGRGADVLDIDGLWLGELVEAGFVRPLPERVGTWDGWRQIPEAVRQAGIFQGKAYAVPVGVDARVILYNKKLFKKAGLPEDWRPTGWGDLFEAGRALNGVDGITPIQIAAGTEMGEAATTDGLLPLLTGNGGELWEDGAWTGGPELAGAFGIYQQIYDGGLGDPKLRREGPDKIEARFVDGEIGLMIAGVGGAADADFGKDAAPALIPAAEPGQGVDDQDFVSVSEADLRMINPATGHPEEAFELLALTMSAEALERGPNDRITPRRDVNEKFFADDPLMSFIAEKALPVTRFRPPMPEYARVSKALQKVTGEIADGEKSPREAAADHQEEVFQIPG